MRQPSGKQIQPDERVFDFHLAAPLINRRLAAQGAFQGLHEFMNVRCKAAIGPQYL